MRLDNTTIGLYGDTNDGKTFLIGEYALYLYLKSNKKEKTIVYLSDKGGWKTISPVIRFGAIHLEVFDGDIFDWVNHVTAGEIRDANKKWIKPNFDVGMRAYESATSVGEEMEQAIKASHEKGVGIGSSVNKSKLPGNDTNVHLDKSHFGLMQGEIRDAIWKSQELPGIVLWSFRARRIDGSETETRTPTLGPETIGKAMTTALPGWFHYTFRVAASNESGAEQHTLYLGSHVDPTTGMAKGVGNTRTPVGAEALPPTIKPASLVKAMQLIEEREKVSIDEGSFRKKYGI